jgi:tripartite-type tricarboxylate transporter receptor subunit TctC
MLKIKYFLGLFVWLISSAYCMAYPNGPLKLIVPFPPAGPTDVIARLVATKLSDALGQPVYIENKSGAHGSIGLQSALSLPADGQTLVMVSIGTHGINPGLYKKLPYDANKDFSAVSLLVTVPIVVVARSDAPFNDLNGLINYAKVNPGKLSFSSAGNGGSSHLVPEMFKQQAKIDLVHVPYKGIAPALTDLLSGQVNLMFDSLITSTQQINTGKLKIIATTTPKRLEAYPSVATIAESGFAGFEASSWYGLVVKSGTSQQTINTLSAALGKIMRSAEVVEKLEKMNTYAIGSTPEEFAKFMMAEQQKWSKVIKEGNIQPD